MSRVEKFTCEVGKSLSRWCMFFVVVYKKCLQALFSRHPVMPDWPANHGWYFAKLNVTAVILLDYFGGAIDIDVDEYFSTQP